MEREKKASVTTNQHNINTVSFIFTVLLHLPGLSELNKPGRYVSCHDN